MDRLSMNVDAMAMEKTKKMNIYVGNVSYQMTDDDLRNAFEAYGDVESARVIMDRDTGRSKGFGFVEMPDRDEAMAAIEGLNGKEIAGRAVTVNEARPRPAGGGGGGGGRRGGFGGGGGGGFGGGGRRY